MNTRTSILIVILVALLATTTALAQEEAMLPVAGFHSPYAVIGQVEANALISQPTFVFGEGTGSQGGPPAHYRWIVKPAVTQDGNYVYTANEFRNNTDFVLPFDAPEWSEWMAWPAEGEPTVTTPELPIHDSFGNDIFYLCAVQIMDEDGVVSINRTYGQSVANFRVSESLAPYLLIQHQLIGTWMSSGLNGIANLDLIGAPEGGFHFQANADAYGAEVASYRWGWDVTDPDDPNDPNWAVPAGLGEEQTQTPDVPFFSTGIHSLTVQVLDSVGNETRFQLMVTCVPMPDAANQLPLLLVDDVTDRNSNAWHDANGIARDADGFRDAFWLNTVSGYGGVAGFDPQRDIIDTEVDNLMARDIVNYRSTIWTGRWAAGGSTVVSSQFRPEVAWYTPRVKYNWLGAYQEAGGNLLYAGSQAALNMLPESPYMLPVVLETFEGGYNGMDYVPPVGELRVGFGVDDLGFIFPRLHPHRNMGVAAIDVASPTANYYLPNGQLARIHRRATCVGTKGLVLDSTFVDDHMGGSAAFADTIWTDEDVDWQDDPMPAVGDALVYNFLWGNDEFYDVDIAGRGTPFSPQQCDGEDCVEPLFRSVSRYDWIQAERQAIDPEDTWPEGYYGGAGQPDLNLLCGQTALSQDHTEALTNDQITGFVTRKHLDQKPSSAGDVVLGFDPYRFDNEAMQSAVRWVLGEHFGLAMTP